MINVFRFNVAITRAKALMIVVGNPTLLKKDYHWRELIDYAYQNGKATLQPHPKFKDLINLLFQVDTPEAWNTFQSPRKPNSLWRALRNNSNNLVWRKMIASSKSLKWSPRKSFKRRLNGGPTSRFIADINESTSKFMSLLIYMFSLDFFSTKYVFYSIIWTIWQICVTQSESFKEMSVKLLQYFLWNVILC